jgi:sugar lactone lactonase YvrE
MNDGACDARGRFWAGTMRVDGKGAEGALYRLGPDRSVARMLDGVGISNGIAWSSDETRMYYVDTPTRGVDVFDFDAEHGTVSNRRRVVEFDGADGEPDGMILDEEDCLWVALWGGWAVRRYSPDGELLGVLDVAVGRVTKCAFGGPELDDLFVTTASPETPDSAQPHAGGVFRARVGVKGRPANLYAG